MQWILYEGNLGLTSEQVRVGFPQFNGLFVKLAWTAAGAGNQAVSHGLHPLLAVRVEENDNGIPLGVVQGVYSLWGDVQQSMSVLGTRKEYS